MDSIKINLACLSDLQLQIKCTRLSFSTYVRNISTAALLTASAIDYRHPLIFVQQRNRYELDKMFLTYGIIYKTKGTVYPFISLLNFHRLTSLLVHSHSEFRVIRIRIL
jgi:hypothetical protein